MSDAGGGALAIVANDVVKSFSTAAGGLVHRDLYTSKEWIKAANFYSSIFQDLISHGYLSPESKSLCVENPERQDVFCSEGDRSIGLRWNFQEGLEAFGYLT